jgi:hypothetical protein
VYRNSIHDINYRSLFLGNILITLKVSSRCPLEIAYATLLGNSGRAGQLKEEYSELDDYFQDLEAAAEDWPKTKRIVLLDDRTETKANGEMKPYHKPLLVKKEHVKDSLSDYKLPEQHHS